VRGRNNYILMVIDSVVVVISCFHYSESVKYSDSVLVQYYSSFNSQREARFIAAKRY
jgi:hypothetical protein